MEYIRIDYSMFLLSMHANPICFTLILWGRPRCPFFWISLSPSIPRWIKGLHNDGQSIKTLYNFKGET